jgi:GNAT superfamily N-acetyltransferase
MLSQSTIIEAQGPERIREIRTLFQEYAAALGFSLCFQDFELELAELPGRYAPPDGRLLLALDGPRAAGCVALRKLAPGVCEMKRFYVRPALRGRGIGRSLAARLIDEAKAAGYRRMRLDTVPAMREAIGLYETLGFRDIPPYVHNPIPGARYLELSL